MSRFIFGGLLAITVSCSQWDNPASQLGNTTYNDRVLQLAPYVLKKPDEISYQDRFARRSRPLYAQLAEATSSKVAYHQATDTANFFFFEYRDLTSLFEHYRGMGGYYKTSGDSVVFVNLFYHTPRLTRDEMDSRGKKLFKEMMETGNVEKFLGNRNYIHTPNADFYYNVQENKWDYTANSSWKFLQEEQKRYDNSQQ